MNLEEIIALMLEEMVSLNSQHQWFPTSGVSLIGEGGNSTFKEGNSKFVTDSFNISFFFILFFLREGVNVIG